MLSVGKGSLAGLLGTCSQRCDHPFALWWHLRAWYYMTCICYLLPSSVCLRSTALFAFSWRAVQRAGHEETFCSIPVLDLILMPFLQGRILDWFWQSWSATVAISWAVWTTPGICWSPGSFSEGTIWVETSASLSPSSLICCLLYIPDGPGHQGPRVMALLPHL